MRLDADRASAIAALIEPGLIRAYPYKPGHTLASEADLAAPAQLCPVFSGCFDWHSAVHSHWALVRLHRLFGGQPWADELGDMLDRRFTGASLSAEYRFVRSQPSFELPYGMAWLLQLDAELCEGGHSWRGHLEPLAQLASERLLQWIDRLPYPIRTGEHNQSALAMALALDWARVTGHSKAEQAVCRAAARMYGADGPAPIDFEPSGHDFLSPALAEADLMRRVWPADRVRPWLERFLPDLPLSPIQATDRSDGKLVHLDGLNFSRAWMLRGIATVMESRRDELQISAEWHERTGLDSLTQQGYAGSHWLGSFAVYACTDRNL